MSLSFKKRKPRKSYEHVVEQIQSAICDGELSPGERLPPELKLKDMFDTSRGTIREALRVLQQKGLISIHTGVKGGARVKEANTDAMSESMALLIRHKKISLAHLSEFRQILERQAAEQAARKATPQNLDPLKIIMEEIAAHTAMNPSNWDTFNQLDARFHMALARIAGNPLVEANLSIIHENIHTYFHHYLPFSQELLEDDIHDLEGILEAVVLGNADRAGSLAEAHVAKFTQMMAENAPAACPPKSRGKK